MAELRRQRSGALAHHETNAKGECLRFASGTLKLHCMETIKDKKLTRKDIAAMPASSEARFSIGAVVRHRMFDFRGVVFDVDPVFANSEDWYQSIPENVRPARDQPFYHLLAENAENNYVAYVSQQNLLDDSESGPVDHPGVRDLFDAYESGHYHLRSGLRH